MAVFVLDQNNGEVKSFLGFRNPLSVALVSGHDPDINYPIKNLFDDKDTTEFSSSVEGAPQEFIFSWDEEQSINYFGVLSKNGSSASISMTVEWLNQDTGLYEPLDIISFLDDAKPYAKYYGDDEGLTAKYYTTKSIKVTIESVLKHYFTAMYCGMAESFDRRPSIGYQPAATAPLDEVSASFVSGNNFIGGVRRSLGFECRGSFDFLDIYNVESWLPEYQNHVLNSKPLFFTMDNNNPHKSFYGRQDPKSMTKVIYKTSFHSSFTFKMTGYA